MKHRAEQICKDYAKYIGEDVPFDAVVFGKRHLIVTSARKVILYKLYFENYGKHSQNEIAEVCGVTKGAVTYAIKVIRDEMRYDSKFRKFIESL